LPLLAEEVSLLAVATRSDAQSRLLAHKLAALLCVGLLLGPNIIHTIEELKDNEGIRITARVTVEMECELRPSGGYDRKPRPFHTMGRNSLSGLLRACVGYFKITRIPFHS